MSTFLIIILIISLIAGVMSRTKPTIEITEKNRHLIKKPKHSDLNKEELKELIINQAGNKEYLYHNSKKIVKLCQQYFKHNGWDLTILEMIITALSIDKNFDECHKYANILIDEKISSKWGYFFKGELRWYTGDISKGNEFFDKSFINGMSLDAINLRKKELVTLVKPRSIIDEVILSVEKDKLSRVL